MAGHDRSTTLAGLLALAHAGRFVTVESTTARPDYTRGRKRYRFTTPGGHRWRFYLPPRTAVAPSG